MVIHWIVLLLWGVPSAVHPSIILQESTGIVARSDNPIFFESAHWDAIFYIDMPCLDIILSQPFPELSAMMAQNAATAVERLKSLVSTNKKFLKSKANPISKALVQASKSFQAVNAKNRKMYKILTQESETIYGALHSSICTEQRDKDANNAGLNDAAGKRFDDELTQLLDSFDMQEDAQQVVTERVIPETIRTPNLDPANLELPKMLVQPVNNIRSKLLSLADSVGKYRPKRSDTAQVHYHIHNVSHSNFNHYHSPLNACCNSSQPSSGRSMPVTAPTDSSLESDDGPARFMDDIDLLAQEKARTRELQESNEQLLSEALSSLNTIQKRHIRGSILEQQLWQLNITRQCIDTCSREYRKTSERVDYNNLRRVMQKAKSSRRKRGAPLQFVGDIWSTLFGTASGADLERINKLLAKVQKQLKASSSELLSIREDQASGYKIINEALNEQAQSIDNQFAEVNKTLVSWSKSLQKFGESLSITEARLTLLEEGVLIMHMLQQFNTMSMFIGQVIQANIAFYRDVKDALDTGVFPYALIPSAAVNKIFSDIRTKLDIRYNLPLKASNQKILSSVSVDGFAHIRSIAIRVKIPILESPETTELWSIQSLPVELGGQWFQPIVAATTIAIERSRASWQPLHDSEVLACRTSPLSICPFPPSWRTNKDLPCAPSVILDPSKSKDVCLLTPDFSRQAHEITAAALTDNEWLISRENKTLFGTLECGDRVEVGVAARDVPVPSYGKVSVPPGCVMTIDSIKLTPRTYKLGSSSEVVRVDQDLINMDLSSVIDLSSSLPHIEPYQFRTPNLTVDHSALVLQASGVRLNDLMQKGKERAALYKSTSEKLEAEYNTLLGKTDDRTSDGWMGFGLFNSWLFTTQGVILLVLSVWTVILTRIVFSLKGSGMSRGIVAAAIPMTSRLPGSFAAPTHLTTATTIHKIGDHTLRSSILAVCNLTRVEIPLEQILTLVRTPWYQQAQFWMMVIIMAVTMLLCSWHVLSRLRHLHLRTRDKLGYIPINRYLTHHVGENKLIVTFLVEFKSQFTGRSTIQTQQAQLCTLPGDASKWQCLIENPDRKFFINKGVNRWSQMKKFGIQWGGLCLKSSEFTSLSTCTELPTQLHLKGYELTRNVAHVLPWCWTMATPMAVTALEISGPGYHYPVYQYHSS